ncbi:MAG: hypothetical protein V4662_15380 [Verrucomicrobiota bacterium]
MNSLFDETLAEFGRSIGMEGLALRDNNALMLDMQRLGTLAVELIGERRDDVSLSLIRQIETPDESACARLLELCHYRAPAPFPVRVGWTRSGQLLFAVRMDGYLFTLPNMHQALDWLTSLHDQSSTFVRSA